MKTKTGLDTLKMAMRKHGAKIEKGEIGNFQIKIFIKQGTQAPFYNLQDYAVTSFSSYFLTMTRRSQRQIQDKIRNPQYNINTL